MATEKLGGGGPVQAPPEAPPRGFPAKGILMMAFGCGLLTCNDAMIKWVLVDHPVGQVVFVRGLFAFLPILLIAQLKGGLRTLRWRRPGGHALCAGLLVAALFLFAFSLSRLPLADAIIIVYTSPLFVTALAPRLLGEKVGWRRWSAVLVGFFGVGLVIQPGGETFSWLLLLPLLVALLVAVRDIWTRKLIATETSISILATSSGAGTLAGLASLPFGWAAMDAFDVGLLAAAGIAFGTAFYFITEAFRFAEASLVSPFKYSAVIWAVILGFVVWGELPGAVALIGALVIVASGVFILEREQMRRRQAATLDRPNRPEMPDKSA